MPDVVQLEPANLPVSRLSGPAFARGLFKFESQIHAWDVRVSHNT